MTAINVVISFLIVIIHVFITAAAVITFTSLIETIFLKVLIVFTLMPLSLFYGIFTAGNFSYWFQNNLKN